MIGPILLIPFFIFLGWHSNFIDSSELANVIREKINYEIVVISTSLVLFQFLCVFYPFDSRVFNHKNLSILIIIEIGMFFGNGTSAGLSEISAFLGFAYFLGYLLSLPNVKVLSSLFVSLLSLCLITFLVAYKFDKPYSWWYVSTDRVQNSTNESRQPDLKGILLNSKASEDIDQIVNTIRFNSAPNDDVFVFPNIQGLYSLSNRMPKSKVIVSWFDFLPDQVAIEEADRLIRHPPKLIVDFDMPEVVWEAHERLFRNGKVIGQRAIKKSILELTSNNMQFKLIYRKKLTDGCQISIWKNRRQSGL
jgi:phosphate/sulfate permease